MAFSRPQPVAHVSEGGSFPDGPFAPGAPPEVHLAAALAGRLKQKIGTESVRYVAKKAGVSAQTVLNILSGKTWPDLRTVARLENSLRARLWGNEHRKTRN